MSKLLYGRLCRLEVLSRDTFSAISSQGYTEAVSFEYHRIQFNVTKSITPEENGAEIIITNRKIDTVISERSVVKLYAGYSMAEGEKLLFMGDVINIRHVVEGPDINTVLTCKEAVVALREPISLSYGEGTSLVTILEDLANKVQEANRVSRVSDQDMERMYFLNTLVANRVLSKSGFSHIGDTATVLDNLCEPLGLQWSVQNAKLHFVPREGFNRTQTVVLSSDSGLVGSVTPIEEQKSGKEFIVKGYKAQTLLFPEILPGDPVSITSRNKSGVFRVEEIEHNGDTHGDRWNSNLKVLEV